MNDGDRRVGARWVGTITSCGGVAITGGWITIADTEADTSHREIVDIWLFIGLGIAVFGLLLLLGTAYLGRDRKGVHVVHSAWGVPCQGFVDVTAVVRRHVRNGALRIHASNDDLVGGPHNDPYVGERKYLVVQWAYDGKAQDQAAWREHDTAVLPPPPDFEPLDQIAAPMLDDADLKLAGEARPREPISEKWGQTRRPPRLDRSP